MPDLRQHLPDLRQHLPDMDSRLDGHPRARAVTEVTRSVWREYNDDRVNDLAAGMAFWVILGVFPGLLALASALGSLGDLFGAEVQARAEEAVLDALVSVVGMDSGSDVVTEVQGVFSTSTGGLLTVGVALAVFSASRGVAGAVRAVDVVYDIEEQRSWVRLRVTAVLLALGSIAVGAALLAVMVLGPLLGGGRAVAEQLGLGGVFAFFWDNLRLPAAFAGLVLWAATFLHVAPDHRSPWHRDVPGALLAAVVWVAVSVGFRVYLDVAGQGNQVFGVLGGGLVLLFWLYLMSAGLLLGAELNAVLLDRRSAVPADAVL